LFLSPFCFSYVDASVITWVFFLFPGHPSEQEVPEEVWDCGPSVRILDVSNNCIKEIPHKIAALKSISVSTLSHTVNCISFYSSIRNYSWKRQFYIVEIAPNCQWYRWREHLLGRSIMYSDTFKFIFKPEQVSPIRNSYSLILY
jgi:hypothetical protein